MSGSNDSFADNEAFYRLLHGSKRTQDIAFKYLTERQSYFRSLIRRWCQDWGMNSRKTSKIHRTATARAFDDASRWKSAPTADLYWLREIVWGCFLEEFEKTMAASAAQPRRSQRLPRKSFVNGRNLLQCFNLLPSELQEILERILIRQQSFKEAADELGVTVATIRNRYYLALKRLGECLEEHGESP